MKILQREIQVEDEGELVFMEMEEVKMCHKETFEYNRQDKNWFTSTYVGGRNDIRHDSQMPLDPEPSRFSDWSSLDSPQARTSPHSAPDIRVEQNENIQNQWSVPYAVVTRPERVRTGSPEGS